MRLVLLAGIASVLLAGCQSPEESMYNAERVCRESGLRPGTAQYRRCVNASYDNNRRQSDQATNAAVIGTAAGVLGGVAVGAASSRSHGYYRCNRWGCW